MAASGQIKIVTADRTYLTLRSYSDWTLRHDKYTAVSAISQNSSSVVG